MADEVVFDSRIMSKWLDKAQRQAKNPERHRQIVSAISAIVFRDVMEHFKDEVGPSGAWKPWSRTYAAHMRKIGMSGNKKLQWSGRLRQNFTPAKVRAKKDAFTWFNNAKTKRGYPYAWGHDAGDGKLPARPFMWLSDKNAGLIGEIFLEEIARD